MGLHRDADLACAAIKMAVAARGGRPAIWRDKESERVIFHTDRGSTYTANAFTTLCRQLGIRQSMGRVGLYHGNDCGTALPIPTRRRTPPRQHCRNTIRPGPSTAGSPTAGTAW